MPVFQVRKPRHIQGHPTSQRTTQIQAQPFATWLPCWLDLKLTLRAWVSAYRVCPPGAVLPGGDGAADRDGRRQQGGRGAGVGVVLLKETAEARELADAEA